MTSVAPRQAKTFAADLAAIVFLVLIFATFPYSSALQGAAKGHWVTLFDGKNLENWNPTNGAPNWHLSGGLLVADAYGECFKRLINLACTNSEGYMVSKSEYSNFEIHAEFWVSHDANSGIFFRCSNPLIIRTDNCYEANIFDERPDQDYRTGAITLIAKPSAVVSAGGKWNTYDITARGPHLTLVLNGIKTVDMQDSHHSSGFIALQASGGVIKFRKVRVKEL